MSAPTCKIAAHDCCHVFFDGGYASKLATAGYLAFAPGGALWFGEGILLDRLQYSTHNDAEFVAAERALMKVATG